MHANYPVSVVIADDHEFFRTGFKKIIQDQYPNELNFVAEAANGQALIEATKFYQPQVVITDIQMPVMNGIQSCAFISQTYPSTKVIAFSMFDDCDSIMRMIQAGAQGYLVKTSPHEEVIEAIRTVSQAQPYYCSTISEKIYGVVNSSNTNRSRKNKQPHFGAQELRIMKLICRQFSIKEIAMEMKLATRTVENYRQNILEKIGARNVVGIALYALINDLVTISEIF
jgi:DNA-binding NarL/FixJ family response regulator